MALCDDYADKLISYNLLPPPITVRLVSNSVFFGVPYHRVCGVQCVTSYYLTAASVMSLFLAFAIIGVRYLCQFETNRIAVFKLACQTCYERFEEFLFRLKVPRHLSGKHIGNLITRTISEPTRVLTSKEYTTLLFHYPMYSPTRMRR